MDAGDIVLVERDCQDWIEAVTGEAFSSDNFRESLQDGILLCRLLNVIRSGTVTKINSRPGTFSHLENLKAFVDGCKSVGIPQVVLFAPADIQAPTRRRGAIQRKEDDKRVRGVLVTLFWLSQKAKNTLGYVGPQLDVENYTQLMKDPWASPTKKKSRIQRPSLPGVEIEPLGSSDVTGLRRATLAEPVLSSRPKSPSGDSDRPKAPLSDLVSPSTVDGAGHNGVGTQSLSLQRDVAPPSTQSLGPLRSNQRTSLPRTDGDLTPTTRRISTGGQITFSIPPRPSLTTESEEDIAALQSLPQHFPEPILSSSSSDELLADTGPVVSNTSTRKVSHTPAQYSASPREYSSFPANARDFFEADVPPPSRKPRGSESGIAFLEATLKVTVVTTTPMPESDSDSDDDVDGRGRIPQPAAKGATQQPARDVAASIHAATRQAASPAHVTKAAPEPISTPACTTSSSPSAPSWSPPVHGEQSPKKPPRPHPGTVPRAVPVETQLKSASTPQSARDSHSRELVNESASAVSTAQVFSAPDVQLSYNTGFEVEPALDRIDADTGECLAGPPSWSQARHQEPIRVPSPVGPPPPPQRDATEETKRHQLFAARGRQTHAKSPVTVSPLLNNGGGKAEPTSKLVDALLSNGVSKQPVKVEEQASVSVQQPVASYKPTRIEDNLVDDSDGGVMLPAVTVRNPTSPKFTARRPNVTKSLSFSSGSDAQRLVAEEQRWKATRRRSELAKEVELLLDGSLFKTLPRSASNTSATSESGSEAFLSAAALDARMQEKQQLKLLQESSQPLSSHDPPRPASAAGILQYDTTDGGQPASSDTDTASLPASIPIPSPSRALSPISPAALDLLTGINKDKSEMERLLALAADERTQQLEVADDQRRMSLDQKEEELRKQRDKVVRALAKERRLAVERDRQKKWQEVEEERLRQMQEEEEEEEAQWKMGSIEAMMSSREALNEDADSQAGESDGIDAAKLQEVEDEPVWGTLPVATSRDDIDITCDVVDGDTGSASPEDEPNLSNVEEEIATTSSPVAEQSEVESADESPSGESPPVVKHEPTQRSVSEVTISEILDPLASAIESLAMSKSERRRSITPWSPDSSTLASTSLSARSSTGSFVKKDSRSSLDSSSQRSHPVAVVPDQSSGSSNSVVNVSKLLGLAASTPPPAAELRPPPARNGGINHYSEIGAPGNGIGMFSAV